MNTQRVIAEFGVDRFPRVLLVDPLGRIVLDTAPYSDFEKTLRGVLDSEVYGPPMRAMEALVHGKNLFEQDRLRECVSYLEQALAGGLPAEESVAEARALLARIETEAGVEIAVADEHREQGRTIDAFHTYERVIDVYAGTVVAGRAATAVAELAGDPTVIKEQKAAELLATIDGLLAQRNLVGARSVLRRVVKEFAGTLAARTAEERLMALRQ
jgi:hypothetical protein